MKHRTIVAVAAPAVVLALNGAAEAQRVFVADSLDPDVSGGALFSVNPDGSDLHRLLLTGSGLRGLAIDRQGGHIVWTDVASLTIRRRNLDGTYPGVVCTALPFPFTIRLDPVSGMVYWGDPSAQEIRRAPLDGSSNTLVVASRFHFGMFLDSANAKLYWSRVLSAERADIVRSNLDGTSLETLVTGPATGSFKPAGVAVDVAAGKIYWTDYVLDVVRRANMDGSMMEDLYIVGQNLNPNGIALDTARGKVYWGQDRDADAALMRMDLDGSHPEVVAAGFGAVIDIAIVESPPCYANCDGSSAAPVLNTSDFACFQASFLAGDSYANCDESTTPPVLNINDLICFMTRFVAGCP